MPLNFQSDCFIHVYFFFFFFSFYGLSPLVCSHLELTSETMNPYLVPLLRWDIGPSKCLYLHRIAQQRKTRTTIHYSSGIWTPDPSFRAVQDRALGHTGTVIPSTFHFGISYLRYLWNMTQFICISLIWMLLINAFLIQMDVTYLLLNSNWFSFNRGWLYID
jgi:hypothetical protein